MLSTDKKVLISYWSGTGNTEAMAKQVAQGAKDAGAEAVLKSVAGTTPDLVKEAAAAFGCPAMGANVDGEGIITQLEPDESSLAQCYELGKRLAV
jgi:flavodoxin